MGFLEALQLSLFGRGEKKASESSKRPLAKSSPNPVQLKPVEVEGSQSIIVQRSSRLRSPTLNQQFQELLQELCFSIQEFQTFDMRRVVVSIGTSRSRGKSGVWAYVTPLRYVGGHLFRRGMRRGIPGFYTYCLGKSDLEAPQAPLYLMTVLIPRFFHLNFHERIETLVHELYHFHPHFRGDLRRFPRPHIHHGPTPKAYNLKVKSLVEEALHRAPHLKSHPLLVGEAHEFSNSKKLRVSRPTLKFVPKFFAIAMLLFSSSSSWSQSYESPGSEDLLWPPSPSLLDQQRVGRNWRWPWETEELSKEDPNSAPLKGDFLEYDEQNKARGESRRHLVSPTEELHLKTAPSEWAADMPLVRPGESFLAYTVDTSGKWVFLRTRRVQGWAPLEKLKVVGTLEAPPSGGSFDDFLSRSAGVSSMKTEPGMGSEVTDSNMLSFDRDLDTVVVTRGGPFHEQPDPLAIRYGQIQPGDQVSILKRDGTGEWSYVRLLLTGEEGWFPSEWLRITRGFKVQGAGKGRIAIDLDGNYGAVGRNFGAGFGLYVDLLGAKSAKDSRFEIGGFYNYFVGENLEYINQNNNTKYSLASRYSLIGGGGRLVGFANEGLLGGGAELAITYQKMYADISGLSSAVLAATGILKDLEPKIGLMTGLRGIVSITSWLQANTLVRVNFASGSTSYWVGLGLSIRIF